MPIPRKTIPVSLNKATPTQITVDGLKKQLTAMGAIQTDVT